MTGLNLTGCDKGPASVGKHIGELGITCNVLGALAEAIGAAGGPSPLGIMLHGMPGALALDISLPPLLTDKQVDLLSSMLVAWQ
ncbi:hypothetical protein F5J12DRAFT_888575 [Pisolithus orientalis]|uniref:uncharacterized protein n=1 Tax=Pisolithus orientalis TaxID=936130 RepID=UPI002225B360|nr:uncharacterized protein F5J12DRAFT_888575 [Pisolithus orientalis]KAI6030767.1 hypothetical protein F5J12DRAFT_888575 [Pisolithus orientalis]